MEGMPSMSFPRKIWPEVSSRVQTWPYGGIEVSCVGAVGRGAGGHTCASFRSLIGIPMLPMFAVYQKKMELRSEGTSVGNSRLEK